MARITEITVPDLGGASDVPVIEILVSVGDEVKAEDPLVTLESDKAVLEVPSPEAGIIREIKVALGDKLSQGSAIVSLEVADAEASTEADASPVETPAPTAAAPETPEPAAPKSPAPISDLAPAPASATIPATVGNTGLPSLSSTSAAFHASPSVRRYAQELGVDPTQVTGSGRKGRISREDVANFVKAALAAPASNSGTSLPVMPEIDFSRFGEIETRALTRINKLTGSNLSRAWLTIPHVTQHDEADISELEDFRKAHKADAEKRGLKLTLLAFAMKAVVMALKAHPEFNASLDPSGENLILKHYYNLGIAVDTPNGLVVPVIRDVDQKSLYDLAAELAEVSGRAREKKLAPKDFEGGCFTISSLGGIGGTAFTPIVNAPEVAILGLSRARMQPVYEDGSFVPRLILPYAVSYDHRVIDGAAGARFSTLLGKLLGDIRGLLL